MRTSTPLSVASAGNAMRGLDFSSWQGLLSTLVGLAIITLIGVGIRLLVMQVVQQKRERDNRQINERLRTLIAAYKTLGGSFTGDLHVDPRHLRQLQQRAATAPLPVENAVAVDAQGALLLSAIESSGNGERARRIRDAVEAALSDVILLGTDEQVKLAARAAQDLVAGRPVHTDALVRSLRDFVRQVLDLESIPGSVDIPRQGPARPSGSSGGKGGAAKDDGEAGAGKGGGGAGGGGGGMMAGGIGLGIGANADDDAGRST